MKWSSGDGDFGTLSYEKMKQVVSLNHPRKFKDGKSVKISLCEQTGGLASQKDFQVNAFEEMGVGVSLYFKFMKSVIAFYFFCTFLCIPLYYLYSRGEVASKQPGLLTKAFTSWTLGNIG
jgi:hypothetical protein